VLKYADEEDARAEAPESGCYITGLFLEGAAWNDAESVLRDSDPKIIHVSMPIIHFMPNYIPDQPEKKLTS
jgi:dynein heavy chain